MNLEKLTEARKQKGFTHEEMADALGYKDKSSYCLIENGKVRITVEIARKIKEKLQLSDEDFIAIFFSTKVEDTQTLEAI